MAAAWTPTSPSIRSSVSNRSMSTASVSGRTITSESRKNTTSPSATRAPRLRAAAGPTRPEVVTMRTGNWLAMARVRSVEPSSTRTSSKSR